MRKKYLIGYIIIVILVASNVSGCGMIPDSSTAKSGNALNNMSELPETLLENGWEIYDATESSFNSDGYKYVFVVYQEDHSDAPSEELILKSERVLYVIKEFEDGNYEVITKNENAVLKTTDSGAYFHKIEITENRCTLSFYGGASWPWWEDFTFELNTDSILLIERYYNQIFADYSGSCEYHYYYKEGILEKKEYNSFRNSTTTTEKIEKQQIDISDFNIYKILWLYQALSDINEAE